MNLHIPVPFELAQSAAALIAQAKLDIGLVEGITVTPEQQKALQDRIDVLCTERKHWPIVLEWKA